MARITNIQIKEKESPIRVMRRTAAEVSWNKQYFSLRLFAAGAEQGIRPHKEDIQLDREQAACLRELLTVFLEESSGEE